MRELVRYWQPDDDWRKCEAGLNALPHSSPQSMGSTFTSFMSARTYECLAGHHHARLARIAQGASASVNRGKTYSVRSSLRAKSCSAFHNMRVS